MATRLDNRKFAEFGLVLNLNTTKSFLLGIGIGGISVAIVFLLLWSWEMITVERTRNFFSWSWMLYFFKTFFVSFWEETLFRAYLIPNIREQFKKESQGNVWALIITSLLFGFAHTGTSDFSPLALLQLTMHGSVYGLAYILSRNLWLPIGIHLAWNFTQLNVFGLNMSGFESNQSILTTANLCCDLITGGNYGPEGGLIGFIGVGLVFSILLWLRLKNKFKQEHYARLP